LRRICGGFIDEKLISLHKIEALENILNDQPTIILCVFIAEVIMIYKKLKNKKLKIKAIYGKIAQTERTIILKEFNSGKIDYIVAMQSCVAEGVNLSRAQIAVFFSSSDSGVMRSQVEDRFIDNNTNVKYIIDLICLHTIETVIVKRVKGKNAKLKAYLEYFKSKELLCGTRKCQSK
jgi:hypothetical protein